jgi:hypothetical protein
MVKDFFLGRQWRGRDYLISPFADASLAGGLAFLLFLLLFIVFPPIRGAGFERQKLEVATCMAFLAFFINDPHFIASYQLLYRNYPAKLRRFRDKRELWLRYIVAGIVAPAAMALYGVYALTAQRTELFSMALLAMLLTVGWHYAKQAYGVFIVLSAVKKVSYKRWQRQILLYNSYIVWLFYVVATVAQPPSHAQGIQNFAGIYYAPPYWFQCPLWVVYAVGAVFVVLGFAALIVAVWEKPEVSKTALMGYFSMYYLLLAAGLHPMWVFLYPFLHSIQYLLFVYAYKRGEMYTSTAAPAQAKAYFKRFFATAFALGILFFVAAPGTVEAFIPDKSIVFPLTAMVAIFINIHHYFIDNVIWRHEHAEVATYLFAKPDTGRIH